MKVLFLIPPSEWKNVLNSYPEEDLSFKFDKPLEIACKASEKDLKCSWNRYSEWIWLNKSLNQSESIDVIHRYNWEMYKAIDYLGMSNKSKKFFEQHFLIFSWMYWIVKPLDKIGNYKLPIETKWLYRFWWDIIPNAIVDLNPSYIVNLLPISYAKLIWEYTSCNRHKKKKLSIMDSWIKIVNVNFYKIKEPPLTPPSQGENKKYFKISHWVKKIKWAWINDMCEKGITDYRQFWWEIIENWNEIEVRIVIN